MVETIVRTGIVCSGRSIRGMLEPLGMPNLGDRLTAAQVDLLKKYIASSAKQIIKK